MRRKQQQHAASASCLIWIMTKERVDTGGEGRADDVSQMGDVVDVYEGARPERSEEADELDLSSLWP
jgi:hypothetical protein